MTCRTTPVEVTEGSCLDLVLDYKDEDGVAEDITDDTFAVSESYPAGVFDEAVLTKTDAPGGTLSFHLEAADAAGLHRGNVNWVRVSRTDLDGHVDNSEQIWVNLR